MRHEVGEGICDTYQQRMNIQNIYRTPIKNKNIPTEK